MNRNLRVRSHRVQFGYVVGRSLSVPRGVLRFFYTLGAHVLRQRLGICEGPAATLALNVARCLHYLGRGEEVRGERVGPCRR
jgi:hypothetical protein